MDEAKYTREYFAELVKKTESNPSEVAHFLGVSHNTVYRWLRGEGRIPKMAFIILELLLKGK